MTRQDAPTNKTITHSNPFYICVLYTKSLLGNLLSVVSTEKIDDQALFLEPLFCALEKKNQSQVVFLDNTDQIYYAPFPPKALLDIFFFIPKFDHLSSFKIIQDFHSGAGVRVKGRTVQTVDCATHLKLADFRPFLALTSTCWSNRPMQ